MSCDSNCSNSILNEGAIGPTGAQGNGWSHGSGAPSGTPSNNQVYYFDTSAGSVYFWNGSSWVLQFTYSGNTGVFGGYAQQFTYNSTTTSGTSAGQIRFNNSSILSSTVVYLNDQDVNSIDTIFSNTDLNPGDKVRVFNTNNSTKYILFTITSIVSSGGEYVITINPSLTEGSSGTVFNNGDSVAFSPVYVDPSTEDQRHSLKIFNERNRASLNTIAREITIDTDNPSAELFQSVGDSLNLYYVAYLSGAGYTNTATISFNTVGVIVAEFHEETLIIEAKATRVSDTQVDLSYKIFQNTTLQEAGFSTITLSTALNAGDFTIRFSSNNAATILRTADVEHIKYTSTTL